MPTGNGPGCRGRALVTNDDGVHSDGLHALAEAADAMQMDVLVVAPSFDASGSSASMTVMASDGRVVVENLTDRTGRPVLGVHGPPAFIVRAAMYGAFGPPPDVVLSGVNRGHNTGRAVLHSGTVGAALTAAIYGRRGLAVSAGAEGNEPWDPSSPFTKSAISWLLACPEATVLNVNIPAGGDGPPKGVRSTTLAECGTVQGNVTEVTGSFVPVTFDDNDGRPAAGTDAAALAEGFVSVTAIRAATVDPAVRLDELLVGSRTS